MGVTKTYTNIKSVWWWPGLFSDVKKMVDLCQTCMMSRKTNLRKLEYHPLETVHRPRTLAYMDVLGPVSGIKSEHCYVLTVLDEYSRLLATRPMPNKRARTVADAAIDIFNKEMGVPERVIVGRNM